ncbi:MAG: LysM peptidoglycan-binding domain-containing protein [Burkholderiaceae bacterium]|nr:LysM peptidoglycan-binding domain-containing protein [Burkholderiaceae bacterium]
MPRSHRFVVSARRALVSACLGTVLAIPVAAHAVKYPITEEHKSTAQQVATAGVPLSELAPNAPDSYMIKSGDTLWDISTIFLKSPWRWPELWGMNLEQIRNPHLIYPGQMLVLIKSGGRATLQFGQMLAGAPPNTVKLSPRIRSEAIDKRPLASIPLNLIEPFLNEAVIFDTDELKLAPRIVATQEGRVLLSRGDKAYVRGVLGKRREYRVFREPKPLLDPSTKEILGFEATYLGTAHYTREAETRTADDGRTEIVPATFVINSIRQEIGVGDRLAEVPPREFSSYAPHAPTAELAGQIVSIYGEALTAGQNQVVALNRGSTDGVERGHVLALWRDGVRTIDKTDPERPEIKLPDERHGMLFVFRVFNRMSYALILTVADPVKAGDRFTQP